MNPNDVIIKKALNVTIQNGWEAGVIIKSNIERYNDNDLIALITHHDFAKYLFGEKNVYLVDCTDPHDIKYNYVWMNEDQARLKDDGQVTIIETLPAWKYHLKEMVASDDMFVYINLFLNTL